MSLECHLLQAIYSKDKDNDAIQNIIETGGGGESDPKEREHVE